MEYFEYSEEAGVARLEVDCGDAFDALGAWRNERLQALLAAMEPIGNVRFVVRYISAPGPGDAPGGHWAVRLASDPNKMTGRSIWLWPGFHWHPSRWWPGGARPRSRKRDAAN